jgi:hypothetical protein
MKILFIYPKFIKYLESFPEISFPGSDCIPSYSYPPALGISVLMSITDERHQCVLQDENVEEIDYSTDADVIAVSFFTPQASFAYDICSRFRALGKIVVIGGVHPSVFTEEAQDYADVVCVGEGERSWPQILSDIEKSIHKKIYRQDSPTDLDSMPLPSRLAYYGNTDKYGILIDYLELSRGCNASCDSCVVPNVSGRDFRFRSIEKIVANAHALRYPMCFITDDIVFMQQKKEDRKYLMDLFSELGRSGFARDHGFYISSTAIFPPDKELLDAMQYAGATVSYFTFGFDPLSNMIMTGCQERFRQRVIDQVKQLQDAGLLFYGAFHLGFDDHTVAIKDNILEFCHDANVKMAQFCLRMPWPGTIMWKQLNKEGRILHTDWKRYNGSNVVFTPKKISAQDLQSTIVDLWKEFSFNFHKLYELQRTGVVNCDSVS